jgi:hypothetical protein
LLSMHWAIEAKDRPGILATASATAPYMHPRLDASDVRIRSEHAGKSDAELKAEIPEIERRLALTIDGEAEPVQQRCTGASAQRVSQPARPHSRFGPGRGSSFLNSRIGW